MWQNKFKEGKKQVCYEERITLLLRSSEAGGVSMERPAAAALAVNEEQFLLQDH